MWRRRTQSSFGPPFVHLALAGNVLLAFACGSGGGGGGGGATAPITMGNAETLAGAVVRAIHHSVFVPLAVDAAIPPDVGALQAAGEIPGRDIPATSPRAAFGPNVVDCDVSGDIELQGDVADPGTYTQGDVVMGDYTLCSVDLLYEFDGRMDFTIASLSGDLLGNSYATRLAVVFGAFDTSFGVLDGRLTVDLDTTTNPSAYGVSGSSLTIEENGGTHTLVNFTTDVEVYPIMTRDRYAFSTDGQMTSSEFTGSVSFTTTADLVDGLLVFFPGELPPLPPNGELRILGRSNASIRVDPVDTFDVHLNIDLDGNGSIDALVETTWDELLLR